MAEALGALIFAVRRGLAEAADPAKAPAMQAYMKSALPFRGVPKPVRAKLLKTIFAAHPLPDRVTFSHVAATLWREAEFREERYAVIALTGLRQYAHWQDPGLLPLYEEMVVTGAWWDYVDEVAIRRIGPILRAEPARVTPIMTEWVREFVAAHPGLSTLSRREALKHLGG